ncbi:hypothetical protein A0H81_09976 [Grifola frondosa]|uniref:Uncharacterized protein n=1 Tax=Grifola frondosa TaxID=5627 RepID=A0A1C7LZ88_GRIFR|nr:hypothetical protein A0H81_09976 [Grifola frondosa]
MEFRLRYPQPFTLEDARQLDIGIITEEMSRLQNSLNHLKRTQEDLREALLSTPGDPDFMEAVEENEDVIGSQQERISILRIVLSEKGIPISSHYDIVDATNAPPRPVNGAQSAARSDTSTRNIGEGDNAMDDDGGMKQTCIIVFLLRNGSVIRRVNCQNQEFHFRSLEGCLAIASVSNKPMMTSPSTS